MNTLLSLDACLTLDSILLSTHTLLSITEDNGKIISLDDLIAGQELRKTGYYYLQNAFALNSIAIAQQSLLMGDIGLEELYQTLTGFVSDSSDIIGKIYADSILNYTSYFLRNFSMYFVSRQLIERKNSPAKYAFAYNMKSASLMKSLINLPYEIIYQKDSITHSGYNIPPGWYYVVDSVYHLFPTPDEVVSGQFYYPPQLYDIMENRQKIFDAMRSYEIYHLPGTDANPDLRKNVNYLILNN